MQPQSKQKKQQQQSGGGYSQLMSGFSQSQLHQEDSMQCSEVMTVNQTNGLITSNNNHNLSANSDQQIHHHQHNNNNHKNPGIDRKDHEKKTLQALQKEYDIMQFNYANEDYSFQINRLCKRISSEKHAQDIACKFPLYKMIRSIVKKFLLNELELLFLGYVLEESKWKVDDIEVRKHAYYMNDFLNITEVKDVLDYKAVLLYLILTAYGVKFYLNEEADMVVFGAHMNTIVKDFATLFQYWSKNYGSTSFKIVPKSLNRVYRNLMKKPTDANKRQHEDYNALVDAIIQISPPYNNEKTAANTGVSTSAGNATSSNNNNTSEIGESTVKQVKLDNGSVKVIPANGNNTKLQSTNDGNKTAGSTNRQSNYAPQHNQLLRKIVENKQQPQPQQQQQPNF